MKFFITLITIAILLLSLSFVSGHENEKYKHRSTGPCYGWVQGPNDTRICYTNRGQTWCKTLIMSHGTFHVSDEYYCNLEPTEEEE